MAEPVSTGVVCLTYTQVGSVVTATALAFGYVLKIAVDALKEGRKEAEARARESETRAARFPEVLAEQRRELERHFEAQLEAYKRLSSKDGEGG